MTAPALRRADFDSGWREIVDAPFPHYLQQLRYTLSLAEELAADTRDETVAYLRYLIAEGQREAAWRRRARQRLGLGEVPGRIDRRHHNAVCDRIDLAQYFWADCDVRWTRPDRDGRRNARCPFCQSGGAFYLWPARNGQPEHCWCHACRRGGDAVNVYMLINGMPDSQYRVAVTELSALLGLPLPTTSRPAPREARRDPRVSAPAGRIASTGRRVQHGDH